MSDQGNTPPENGSNGEEPTRAYQPVHDGDADSTRLERPIRPYDDEREPVPATILPPGYREYHTNVALLIAVALLSILIGIGLGYLLFHGSSDDSPTPVTTTTAVVESSTTTTEAPTTTTTEAARTTTTARATTTTRAPTTTTTLRTTTTAAGATTSTSSPFSD